jgi:hypothetical protein
MDNTCITCTMLPDEHHKLNDFAVPMAKKRYHDEDINDPLKKSQTVSQ